MSPGLSGDFNRRTQVEMVFTKLKSGFGEFHLWVDYRWFPMELWLSLHQIRLHILVHWHRIVPKAPVLISSISISCKGTDSRELRWVFLYINRKLFSRAISPVIKFLFYWRNTSQSTKEDLAYEHPYNLEGAITIDGRIFYQRTS